MYPQQYWSWHVWTFPMIFMPIFWIIIIGVILYLIFGRRSSREQSWPPVAGPQSETALDILKKRYAKGEITKAEFEQMKRDIS